MSAIPIIPCHIGPQVLSGDFVIEHFFLYALTGEVTGFNKGGKVHVKKGEYLIVGKNQLIRLTATKANKVTPTVTVALNADFLNSFFERHPNYKSGKLPHENPFILPGCDAMVDMFIAGLSNYFMNGNTLHKPLADLKREELLMILFHINPSLPEALLSESLPQRTDLSTFMQSNYKFNASVEHFAFLSGRSLSGFKRDFQKTFNATPNRWLVEKRLQEAHHLIVNGQKPNNIYLNLGFEDLTHFSFAFKKKYGMSPSNLIKTVYNKVSRNN